MNDITEASTILYWIAYSKPKGHKRHHYHHDKRYLAGESATNSKQEHHTKVNSIADSPTDKINCAQSGIYADNCAASKYSAILYCEPKGSIALTKPEKMNVKASSVRLKFTSMDFNLFM